MKNKKVVVGIRGILFVAACVIVFAYFRGNAAYVKVKIHSTKEYQKTMSIDYDHAYMTGTKTMDKFYITKQKHLELDKENAGYGTCEARIPLIDNHKKSKGTIQINYFKANDWFQSDIDLKINIRTIKKRQYLQIKVKLKEETWKEIRVWESFDTKTIFIKRSWKLQDQPWWMIRNGENMTLEDIQTKIDPENIFLMGDSSSGNTAFITAFTADMNCMDTDVYKEYSCKVNAVVDLYGVSCVKIKEDFPTTPNQGEPDSPEGLEIGSKNVYEHPELSDQITCMNYVKKELPSPPVLMMHGTADDTVAPNQSIQLYKKLKEEEKDATFYLVEGADHGHPYFWCEPTLSLIEQFFKKYMK